MCFSQPRSLSTINAVVLILATFFSQDVGARLPPKFLKAASGASKALYARGYGYSVIPIPQKFVIQTNISRREVHNGRPRRRLKRPRRGKRPPPVSYAPKYQDYRPIRKRRPLPIREPPDYHDQQELEEDFEYDDHNYKEFDDFINKHAELYVDGYTTRGKPPRSRYKDEEGAYSENSEPIYARRRPQNARPWQGTRPSTKLYSAAIARPPPVYREEIEDDEEDNFNYRRYKSNRGRYKDYDDEERYNERDEDSFYYRNRYADYNPDDFYHDRKYHEREDNFRRNAGVKKKFSRQPVKETIRFNPISDQETEDAKREKVNKLARKEQSDRDDISDFEKNRWSNIFQQEAMWKESASTHEEHSQPGSNEDSSRTHHWRSYERDSPYGKYSESMKSPSNNDWKEPDIITKQNQEAWEERHQSGIGAAKKSPLRDYQSTWIKEHSVGYGIEIDSGQKKRKPDNTDPDVVYGQSVYSKPRIPDLGYGQGMEVVDDESSRRQIFLR